MIRPKRISMGCYAVYPAGREVILRRIGRRGFRIEMQVGRAYPHFRRLRDAAAAAVEAVNPWPFTVEKQFDLALDIPDFLRRKK